MASFQTQISNLFLEFILYENVNYLSLMNDWFIWTVYQKPF